MFNVLDFIFINLAFTVTCTSVLILNFEKYVPGFIKKGFAYGSFAYKGTDANFLQVVEIPKLYYKHFYLFSSVLSFLSLIYMFMVYFLDFGVSKYLAVIFNAILQEDEPSVSATAALIAMTLLTLQCLRRFYETYYLQVFAKSSKMNLSHYLAGIIHYFACIVVVIGQAPLFCGDDNRKLVKWTDSRTTISAIPCIIIFMWCWHEQYQSNVIFANLRRDKKSGAVLTEEHAVPHGRLFKTVSSPHRMCEIIMYSVLTLLIPTKTFLCIFLWVLANQVGKSGQIQTAVHAHEWYKKTFKNYPTNRSAILPNLL